MLSNTVVVAQLVRASDCGSEGRGFESLLPPHFEFLRGGGLLRQFYCAFFVPTSPRHNPAFTKPSRPIPPHCRFSNRNPIRKNRPHLRHTKVAKSLKFSKSLKGILHRATVLVLNATSKRYIHKFRILVFHISEKSNSDCLVGGNCIRFIILETLKREIPVIREICE